MNKSILLAISLFLFAPILLIAQTDLQPYKQKENHYADPALKKSNSSLEENNSTIEKEDLIRGCGSTIQKHEERMRNDISYRNYVEQITTKRNKILLDQSRRRNPSCTDPILVPVAIHYAPGIVPSGSETCALDIINQQLTTVNEDFAGTNADISNWAAYAGCFSTTTGASCIEFCLATINHPAGSGLVEGEPAVTFGANIDWSTSTPLYSAWAGYLNIFIQSGTGILGISNGIPGNFSGTGVTVEACNFGGTASGPSVTCPGVDSGDSCGGIYDEGRTLTHEIGHYLGLYHIWGDNSTCNGGQDQIADTPNMNTSHLGSTTTCPSGSGCGGLPNTCNDAEPDMPFNYMSYVSDNCMWMFTSGQADVMYATVTSAGFTTTSSKCGAPIPSANFANVSATNIEEGTSCGTKTVTIDMTMSLQPSATTNVSVAISGTATNGTDFTVSATNFTFTTANWNTPQTLTITIEEDAVVETDETIVLDITTVTGSDAIEGGSGKVTLTVVNDDNAPSTTGGIVTVLDVDFESGAGGFQTASSGDPWALGDNATLSSTYWTTTGNATTFGFISDDACNCDLSDAQLRTPIFDLSGATSASLTFDHAFSNVGAESAEVLISTDNGTTYTSIGAITNTSTALGGGSYSTPWVTGNTIDLSAYVGNTQVGIAWRYNDGGGWLYGMAVDNVQVTKTSVATAIQTVVNTGAGFAEHNLGPNQTVHFYDQATGNIMVTIQELSGHDYGCTKVEVDRQGIDDTGWILGYNVTNKTFKVTPTNNNPTGSYSITLYYEASELPAFLPSITSMVKGAIEINNATNNASNSFAEADGQAAFGTDYQFTATFNSGFSGFALSDAPPVPFPVELSYFKASKERKDVRLHWETASELNNKGFHIEYGTDGRHFERIGWVNGKGTTSSITRYEFLHEAPRGRYNYYRLAQEDFDGTTEYTDVEVVEFARAFDIQVFPNPSTDGSTTILQLETKTRQEVNINIFDSAGKKVMSLNQSLDKGVNTINLSKQQLSKGIYFISISHQAGTENIKLSII